MDQISAPNICFNAHLCPKTRFTLFGMRSKSGGLQPLWTCKTDQIEIHFNA
ncbi:hypothetical protein CEV33_0514 [Brucella grignonensis]|uniref:Uncharacterized protein n=1 Tax=Brucella grignonensis TaxID=94627 RepID=A0A256FFQ9_9HYPH|nr:hypothetical protein CEV33_0514 [Brucella grignonensis]